MLALMITLFSVIAACRASGAWLTAANRFGTAYSPVALIGVAQTHWKARSRNWKSRPWRG